MFFQVKNATQPYFALWSQDFERKVQSTSTVKAKACCWIVICFSEMKPPSPENGGFPCRKRRSYLKMALFSYMISAAYGFGWFSTSSLSFLGMSWVVIKLYSWKGGSFDFWWYTPKNILFWGVGPSQPQIQNCDWFSRKAVTFFSGGLAAANSNHNLLKIITPLVWLVLGKTRHNFGRWGGLNRFFSECHLELVVIVYLISFDFMMDSGGNPSHVEIHAKFQSMIEISQFWSLMVFHSQGALTMISEQSSRRPMILNGSA